MDNTLTGPWISSFPGICFRGYFSKVLCFPSLLFHVFHGPVHDVCIDFFNPGTLIHHHMIVGIIACPSSFTPVEEPEFAVRIQGGEFHPFATVFVLTVEDVPVILPVFLNFHNSLVHLLTQCFVGIKGKNMIVLRLFQGIILLPDIAFPGMRNEIYSILQRKATRINL